MHLHCNIVILSQLEVAAKVFDNCDVDTSVGIFDMCKIFQTKENLENLNSCFVEQLQSSASCSDNCDTCHVVRFLLCHFRECPCPLEEDVCKQCAKCRVLDEIHFLMSHTNGFICSYKKCSFRHDRKIGNITRALKDSYQDISHLSASEGLSRTRNLEVNSSKSEPLGNIKRGDYTDLIKLLGVRIKE